MSDPETEVATDAGPPSPAPEAPIAEESIRDTLSRAFTEAEAPPEAKADGAVAPEQGQPTPGQRARDGSGRFSTAVKPRALPKPDGTKPLQSSSTASIAPPEPLQGHEPPQEKPQALASKAPASWKPLAREKWAALPPEVQQEVQRVDQEVRQVMQRSAQAAQHLQSFQQAIRPFEAMIAAEGADPLQATASLFQTAAALRTLPPWPKAQLLANIITTHMGGEQGLELLSKALAGAQPDAQTMQAQQQQGAYRDPRLDGLLNEWEQAKQQRATQVYRSTAQSVEDFGKDKDFFDDLRETMADFHELAARRGEALSFEDSYSAALAHPRHADIRQVIEQRKEAEAAKAQLAQGNRSRLAASSIRSSPVTPLRNGQPSDLRGSLSANWDAAFGGG